LGDIVTAQRIRVALASLTRQELAAHKLRLAETYITNAGMRDVMDEILGAVSGVKNDFGRLNERIDRMHGAQRRSRATFTLDDCIFKVSNINAHLD
jgi:hypothetical protein